MASFNQFMSCRACIPHMKSGSSIVTFASQAVRDSTSEEVAKLVVFLAGDDASYMTGNNVDINGGLLFS